LLLFPFQILLSSAFAAKLVLLLSKENKSEPEDYFRRYYFFL
jgi:hypothetical protein